MNTSTTFFDLIRPHGYWFLVFILIAVSVECYMRSKKQTQKTTIQPNILDGRALAARIREKISKRIADAKLDLGLGVILVGDDPASYTYVRIKEKACQEANIRFVFKTYPSAVSSEELISQVTAWNDDPTITGILVQLPLPSQDTNRVIATIDPNKDVDGFHPENLKNLLAGKPSIAPAVALGVMKLIDEADKTKQATTAAIVSSIFFATPLVHLLKERGIESQVIDPDAADLPTHTKDADVIIVAAGKPHFLSTGAVKQDAIVIDVGTTRVNEKLLGDVHPDVFARAKYMTPVPGGVGPMTVACLLLNILKVATKQKTTHKK